MNEGCSRRMRCGSPERERKPMNCSAIGLESRRRPIRSTSQRHCRVPTAWNMPLTMSSLSEARRTSLCVEFKSGSSRKVATHIVPRILSRRMTAGTIASVRSSDRNTNAKNVSESVTYVCNSARVHSETCRVPTSLWHQARPIRPRSHRIAAHPRLPLRSPRESLSRLPRAMDAHGLENDSPYCMRCVGHCVQ